MSVSAGTLRIKMMKSDTLAQQAAQNTKQQFRMGTSTRADGTP
jgi:hypothetical protein